MASSQQPSDDWLKCDILDIHALLKCQLKRILDALRCVIEHEVLVVGFPIPGSGTPTTVRFAPHVGDFPSSALEAMFARIRSQFAARPSGDFLDDQSWIAQHRAYDSFMLSLKREIKEVLDRSRLTQSWLCIESLPCEVDRYVVVVLVLLSRVQHNQVPHLNEQVIIRRHQCPSLPYAVVDILVDACEGIIRSSSRAVRRRLAVEVEGVLRDAGARFAFVAETAEHAGGLQAQAPMATYGLFEVCNLISSLPYEGAQPAGRLVLARRGHPAVTPQTIFTEPVRVDKPRTVRKLLEMCDANTSLLCGDGQVYGLGAVAAESYDPHNADVFIIRFLGHLAWEMVHNDEVLMRTIDFVPQLPRERLSVETFKEAIRHANTTIQDDALEKLVEVATCAARLKHGAVLVFTPRASEEAARLSKRSIGVEPFRMEPRQVASASAIDGAVLIDHKCTCHAVGVLLDGKASARNNAERGARYNSAVSYVDEHPEAVVLVVSTDGSVDVIAQPVEVPSALFPGRRYSVLERPLPRPF